MATKLTIRATRAKTAAPAPPISVQLTPPGKVKDYTPGERTSGEAKGVPGAFRWHPNRGIEYYSPHEPGDQDTHNYETIYQSIGRLGEKKPHKAPKDLFVEEFGDNPRAALGGTLGLLAGGTAGGLGGYGIGKLLKRLGVPYTDKLAPILGGLGGAGLGYGLGQYFGGKLDADAQKELADMQPARAKQGMVQKRAFLGLATTGAGAGVGALAAPKGHKGEGALRGMGRVGGAIPGAILGGGTGALGGAGIGTLLGFLASKLADQDQDGSLTALGAGLGAGTGGLGGALYGGVKGYQRSGEYMGEPSWKKKKDGGKKDQEKKSSLAGGLSLASGVASNALQGAGMRGARALSRGQKHVGSEAGAGALQGVGGNLGMGLGSLLGALAGGGAGALGGYGLGTIAEKLGLNGLGGRSQPYLSPAAIAGLAGGLGGAGAGFGLGGYYGGRAGVNLLNPKKKEEPDKAEETEEDE